MKKPTKKIPPIERTAIIEMIIKSLDVEQDVEIKKAWETEAKQRLSEYKNGSAHTIPEEEVFNRIENNEYRI